MPAIPSSAAGAGGAVCLMIGMFVAYAAVIVYVLILLTRFVKAHESIAKSAARIADKFSGPTSIFSGNMGPTRDPRPPGAQ